MSLRLGIIGAGAIGEIHAKAAHAVGQNVHELLALVLDHGCVISTMPTKSSSSAL